MRKQIGLFSLAIVLLFGCTSDNLETEQNGINTFPTFYASFDDNDGAGTRTYVDNKMKLRWTEGDKISIFAGNTYNHEYKYDGETGANNGSFSAVSNPGFIAGEKLETNYAVYPYDPLNEIDPGEGLSIVLPDRQKYVEKSFGLGANTMVAITENKEDNFLQFKNLCGYLVMKFYGEGEISSVTLEGNNGEKISGRATVQTEYGSLPSVIMSNDANTSITIDCGDGVVLGTTDETSTEFWFCVPPVAFDNGFTVIVSNSDGMGMRQSVSTSHAITRNITNKMSPLEVTFENVVRTVEFEDANFKAYCVENFDIDGDGEISYPEASAVDRIEICTDNISSVKGVEYFKNLGVLIVFGTINDNGDANGQLTQIDVSKNNALHCLICTSNQLTSLDVSNNPLLNELNCSNNQLTALDVKNNTRLAWFRCENNQLSSLDVSSNESLAELSCSYNQLSSLDVSSNMSLMYLYCDFNHLTTLDVSSNGELGSLHCDYNPLTALDVSRNAQLYELYCRGTRLTSLNLTNNTNLSSLDCSGNNITELDISNNNKLEYLWCYANAITSLDVSCNIALECLICSYNKLTTLDVGNNTELLLLNCGDNQLTTLNVSRNSKLESLYCPQENPLTVYIANGQNIQTIEKNDNCTIEVVQ